MEPADVTSSWSGSDIVFRKASDLTQCLKGYGSQNASEGIMEAFRNASPQEENSPKPKLRAIFLLLQGIPPAFPEWSCQGFLPFVQCRLTDCKRRVPLAYLCLLAFQEAPLLLQLQGLGIQRLLLGIELLFPALLFRALAFGTGMPCFERLRSLRSHPPCIHLLTVYDDSGHVVLHDRMLFRQENCSE